MKKKISNKKNKNVSNKKNKEAIESKNEKLVVLSILNLIASLLFMSIQLVFVVIAAILLICAFGRLKYKSKTVLATIIINGIIVGFFIISVISSTIEVNRSLTGAQESAFKLLASNIIESAENSRIKGESVKCDEFFDESYRKNYSVCLVTYNYYDQNYYIYIEGDGKYKGFCIKDKNKRTIEIEKCD